MFHSFSPTYIEADLERKSDGTLAVKQYEQFKAERNHRLQTLREQKAQMRNTLVLCGLALLLVAMVLVTVARKKRKHTVDFAQGWAQFAQSESFVRISERLSANKARLSAKNVDDFPELALSPTDLTALRMAADTAFGGFLGRLAKRHPDLNQAGLNCCCLALMGLSNTEMAALLGVKYNALTNRISRIKKALGTEENLSDYLICLA